MSCTDLHTVDALSLLMISALRVELLITSGRYNGLDLVSWLVTIVAAEIGLR